MIAEVLIFLAFGSYLNSLGHRLLHLEHFFKLRSFCPHCYQQINWYDNIPLVSWIVLQGKCRWCNQPISWLYPFIELITTVSLYALWQTVPTHYFPAYFLFFSALIITVRTDIDQMLISRLVTIYLIPVGLLAAYLQRLPISLTSACLGTCFGYFLLWCAQKISYIMTGQDCLGQGDLELLAFIGAFTGPLGVWASLTIGSIAGTIITWLYMMITNNKIEKVPLGAYLSCGTIIFVLCSKTISECVYFL